MLLMQSLNKLDSPEQKLEATIKKHAELVGGSQRIKAMKQIVLIISRIRAGEALMHSDGMRRFSVYFCSWRSIGAIRRS